jgi:hypothetical protein
MKKTIPLCFVFITLLPLPFVCQAQDRLRYLAVKPGIYCWQGDLEDEHTLGFNCEIAYGYYLRPHLVIEGSAGYIHDGVHKGNDIRGKTILLSLKRVYFAGKYEPFWGAGAGIYFANYNGVLTGARNKVPMDVDDTVYGGHLLAGVNLNLYLSLFLGLEGKYTFTSNADFKGAKVNLDGFAIMAVLG